MKFPLLLLAFLLLGIPLHAQLSGTVNYEHLGIRFQIPAGWVGQETEEGILMGHNSIPGLVLMVLHEYPDMKTLKREAMAGINEGNGTFLNPASHIEVLDGSSIAAEYAGTIEWQPAQAFGVGMLNPHGSGMSIFALTSQEAYDNSYRQLVLQIKNSVHFSKLDIADMVNQWKPFLSGNRLTYMDSYYSPSGTVGGVSGGYSSKRIIELCRDGGFYFQSNNEMTISGDNVSGYNSGGGEGHGTWTISASPDGSPILRLDFFNGERYEYSLSAPGEALHLDGTRNYRTDCEWCR
ncbi:MAG: hypothetical protein AAF399_15875 [Bacteroidota bacterium]